MSRRGVLVVLILASLAAATAFASMAYGSSTHLPPPSQLPPQEGQLDRTCSATLASIKMVMNDAASAQPQRIQSRLTVITPGVLTARLVFDRSGSFIRVAADRTSTSLTCAQTVGHFRGLGPGRSRTVSTLHRTFTKPGRYTLSFVLAAAGRKILAELGAAQRAYQQAHPLGRELPGIAYGVALGYTSPG